MAKCEVIDLTLSDCDSDGDFIQLKKAIRFCIKLLYTTSSFCYITFLLHQVSTATEIVSQDSCMYVVSTVVSRSQPDLFALPEAGSFTSR